MKININPSIIEGLKKEKYEIIVEDQSNRWITFKKLNSYNKPSYRRICNLFNSSNLPCNYNGSNKWISLSKSKMEDHCNSRKHIHIEVVINKQKL